MLLLDLSNELLMQILTTSSSLHSTLLTCRRLNAIAIRALCTRVQCLLPKRNPLFRGRNQYTDYARMLLKYPERATMATEATFVHPYLRPQIWNSMCEILPKLTSLQTLYLQEGHGVDNSMPPQMNVWGPPPEKTIFDCDSNYIRMLTPCTELKQLRIVHVDFRYITVNEIAAFLNFPRLDFLYVKQFRGGMITDTSPFKQSKLRKLKISAGLLPTGPSTEWLFLRLPELTELSWIVDVYPDDCVILHTWSPSAITRVLLPCRDTLTSLSLVAITALDYDCSSAGVDLLGFTSLLNLTISSGLLPSGADYEDEDTDCRALVQTLPRALQSLSILCSSPEHVNRNLTSRYNWFIHLARSKEFCFPGLRLLCVQEGLTSHLSAHQPRQAPEKIQTMFDAVGIVFRVLLKTMSDRTTVRSSRSF